MNGFLEDGAARASDLAGRMKSTGSDGFQMLLCPPATLLNAVGTAIADSGIFLGGQDCHVNPSGAHTGDISAAMLADLCCSHVIVGHSERRADHGEDDALVKAKAEAAIAAGMCAIVCVGETEAQRDAGETNAVVAGQVQGSLPVGADTSNLVIAYEPVWAIGTGRTARPAEAQEVHAVLRQTLNDIAGGEVADHCRILYGGSVKPGNAAELMALADVDGALVGGASLEADDFWSIAMACT